MLNNGTKTFQKQELLMSKYLNQFPIYWLIWFYCNNDNNMPTTTTTTKKVWDGMKVSVFFSPLFYAATPLVFFFCTFTFLFYFIYLNQLVVPCSVVCFCFVFVVVVVIINFLHIFEPAKVSYRCHEVHVTNDELRMVKRGKVKKKK